MEIEPHIAKKHCLLLRISHKSACTFSTRLAIFDSVPFLKATGKYYLLSTFFESFIPTWRPFVAEPRITLFIFLSWRGMVQSFRQILWIQDQPSNDESVRSTSTGTFFAQTSHIPIIIASNLKQSAIVYLQASLSRMTSLAKNLIRL